VWCVHLMPRKCSIRTKKNGNCRFCPSINLDAKGPSYSYEVFLWISSDGINVVSRALIWFKHNPGLDVGGTSM